MTMFREPPVPSPTPRSRRAVAAALLSGLAACGGGGGGGASAGDLESSLNRLGVDTARTPRQTAPGLTMEPSTSPLGTKPVLARTNELLLANIGLAGPTPNAAPLLLVDLTDANGAAATDLLYGQSANQVAFLPRPQTQSREFPEATCAAVAADCDGNGLDEILLVYRAGIEIRVRRIDDQLHGHASSDVQIAAYAGVTNVAAIAADLDVDGRDELVLGLTAAGSGRIVAFRFDGQGFGAVGAEVAVAPELTGASLTLELAAGNVDQDAAPEVGVAVQEVMTTTGSAKSLVLDDLQHAFVVLRDEPFTDRDQNQVQRIGYTLSIAMGDVDGDGLDEVVLGGLTRFARYCDSTEHLLVALDDREHQFARLGAFWFARGYTGCNSPTDRQVRTIHLHTLDYDGDGRDEIAANQFVFDDFDAAAPFTEQTAWQLPDGVVWTQGGFGHFDRNTSSFVVGDFTGDDREDLAVFREDIGFVDVHGLPATSMTTVRHRRVVVPPSNSQYPNYPLLLPVNVDTDSPVLQYSAADYRLVFSEPIVLAALAAPPTADGIGQNAGASFTAFGNTTTTISERERSITFTAGVSVGVNLDGGPLTQSEYDLKVTMNVAAERTRGTAYELSKTILFTSAPREDLVVFTSVPVDQYTFTILSHPDAALIGQHVVVNYPRSPITLQAERGFYNQTVPERSMHVDAAVFQHEVGRPASYPDVASKNALLAAHGGLEIGPQSVGQGGGSTEVTLQVGTSVSEGGALAIGFERDVEATLGGVLVGTTIGVSAESRWRISSGASTTYTGVVGAIDAPHFAANRYSFGLFTYAYRAPVSAGQFQVLNYWVE